MSATKNAIYEANEYAAELQTNLVAILGESIGRLEAESLEQLTLLTESGYYFIKSGVNWGVYSPEIAWLEGFSLTSGKPDTDHIAQRLAEIYTRLTRVKLTPTFLPENANRVEVSYTQEFFLDGNNAPNDFEGFFTYWQEKAADVFFATSWDEFRELVKVRII